MKRAHAIIFAPLGTLLLAVLAMYVLNPYHLPSDQWGARIFGIGIFTNPSDGMLPTVPRGSHFLNSAIALRNRDPQIGEIVVFKYPPSPNTSYLKRVVAAGGSVVEIRAGVLYVDGRRIHEPYLASGRAMVGPRAEFSPYKVPLGQFFVMGDNRDASEDSRAFGPVPRILVVGTYLRLFGG